MKKLRKTISKFVSKFITFLYRLRKKIILWAFFKYCRDSEWEIYKNNLNHLLMEIRLTFVRDIITRTSVKGLKEKLLNSNDDYETIVSIIQKSFIDKNYY